MVQARRTAWAQLSASDDLKTMEQMNAYYRQYAEYQRRLKDDMNSMVKYPQGYFDPPTKGPLFQKFEQMAAAEEKMAREKTAAQVSDTTVDGKAKTTAEIRHEANERAIEYLKHRQARIEQGWDVNK